MVYVVGSQPSANLGRFGRGIMPQSMIDSQGQQRPIFRLDPSFEKQAEGHTVRTAGYSDCDSGVRLEGSEPIHGLGELCPQLGYGFQTGSLVLGPQGQL